MRTIPLGSTAYFKFTTRAYASGAPTTLSGTPSMAVYEENNLTQITAGLTLSADYDSVTGLNDVAVVATAANGYEAGKTYYLTIAAGTVGGTSVVGEVVAEFQIESASDLATRIMRDDLYPAHELGASASHSTTVIDMTGILDANTPADGNVGVVYAVVDDTDDHVEYVVVTALTVTTLLATVRRIDDGGALGFTPANLDRIYPVGVMDISVLDAILADTGTTLPAQITTAQNDLDIITGASGVVLQDGSITAAKIATDAITAAKIAADAIGASELATDAVSEIVAAIFARTFDATDMSSLTFEELTALMACALLAKASGLDTATAVFRNLADGADAITATVDASGNRSAVTLTLASVR